MTDQEYAELRRVSRQRRARTFSKLHHPDPSGFWNLVRTGEKLPVEGQQILYVLDVRGTDDELHQQLMAKIANGDPYRCGIVAQKKEGDKIFEHEVMIDELLKLPTEVSPPKTMIGVVEKVEFDSVMGDWIIFVYADRGWPGFSKNPDHIVYWAPMPTPPNTYTPRTGDDDDLWYYNGRRSREQRVLDYLETRRYRKEHPNE